MPSHYDVNNNQNRNNNDIYQDDQISEGEIVTPRRTPDQEISSTNNSLIYASNESLDKDYLRDFSSRVIEIEHDSRKKVKRKTKSPTNLQTSLNSTLSASNFITQEKLMEKFEISKKAQPESSTKPKMKTINNSKKVSNQNITNGRKSPSKSILKQPKQKTDAMSNTSSQTFVSSNVFNKSPSKDSYTQANIPYTTSEQKPKTIPSMRNDSHKSSIDSSVNRFYHASMTPVINKSNEDKMVTVTTVEQYDSLSETFLRQLCTIVDTVNFMNTVAYSPAQRIRGFKNLKVLRGLIRDNEILQEQLVDANSTPGHPVNSDNSIGDEKIDQIRQPYYSQVLLKRIQTLDADREVLRQLNKSLLDENENLKLRSHRSVNDKDVNINVPQINLQSTEKQPVPEDPKMKNQINQLKNQIDIMNEELMEYKKHSLTSDMINSSLIRRRDDSFLSQNFPPTQKTPYVSHEQWENLCEHSKLVLEENQLLVDQKTLYKKTINDLSNDYQLEVTRLTTQLGNVTRDKNKFEHALSEKEIELSLLRDRYASITEKVEKSMEKTEHETKIERIHKNYMNEITNLKHEMEKLLSALEAANKEKSRLAIQVTDLTATNSRLTLELKMAEKNSRKADRRLYQCMAELQNVCNKEVTAKGTLSEVLKLAEKTAYEREHMAAMVESQKEKTQVALNQIQKDDATLQELRRELKNTKERRKNQFSKIKQHIYDQETEVTGIIGKYQEELKGLKDVIREKQKFIDRMQTDKQLTEFRLDDMWRSLHAPYPVIKGYDGRT